MLELIAQGTEPEFRWRRPIPVDQPFVLGRSTDCFRVPWDNQVSRSHAKLRLLNGKLAVQKLDEAANPVFFNGHESASFVICPGDHFVIGQTSFTMTKDHAFVTQNVPNPISQKTFSPEFLHRIHYRDANQRIDVLSRLPEIISSASNQQQLMDQLVNTLLAGIPSATMVGIVKQHDSGSTDPEIEILHWDRRGIVSGDFQPSEKLICQAIESSESVLHVWHRTGPSPAEFTFDYENDWAFVCPMDSNATSGWGIYVAGSDQRDVESGDAPGVEELQDDVKFCELVSSTLKNLLLVNQLQRRQASLHSFFSPVVLNALTARDPEEALAPTKCKVSVLFCDLRGFAKASESMADEIFQLLDRVSRSLDIMTGKILEHSGVIGDFQGDSAMGFWGWPLAQTDTADQAVKTALAIESAFNSQPSDFRIGIGIATGMAVAGKIGTRDQVKVTVFGPVVNLAARLEGMTRPLGCSVLLDRATLDEISSELRTAIRSRKLGKFKPYGMTSQVDVFELVTERFRLDANAIEQFELAIDQFQNGHWQAAGKTLGPLPDHDPGKTFLLEFMRQNHSTPPDGWDGVIEMHSK